MQFDVVLYIWRDQRFSEFGQRQQSHWLQVSFTVPIGSPIDLRFGTDASLIFDRGGGYGSDGVAELQLAEVETAMMRIRRQWNLRVLLTMLVCKRVHKKRSINRIFYWVGQDGLCPLP
jgi:hypothetical protein